ncbi:hypothetical protein BJ508DRAFT_363074 [Ascobolus immersus RN42]|uniref:Pentacotripeptide-repeat region of PRORP domain-containing protein n=1 Tax=Ascobolus immersus RN42 TaxID=1160509 RepID=A0A3N4I0P9_ASCIM|nr:hypothetical protein BJ508DRAFT_363074 [Ascobolus immersus RN42]
MRPLAGRTPSICAIRYLRQLVFPSHKAASRCFSHDVKLRHSRRLSTKARGVNGSDSGDAGGNIDARIFDTVSTRLFDTTTSKLFDTIPVARLALPSKPPLDASLRNTPSPPPEKSKGQTPSIHRHVAPNITHEATGPASWIEDFSIHLKRGQFKPCIRIWRQMANVTPHSDEAGWNDLFTQAHRLMVNINKLGKWDLTRQMFDSGLAGVDRKIPEEILVKYLGKTMPEEIKVEYLGRKVPEEILVCYLAALRKRVSGRMSNSVIGLWRLRRAELRGVELTSRTYAAILRLMVDEGMMRRAESKMKEWQRSGLISSAAVIPVLKGWTRIGSITKIEELRKWMAEKDIKPGKKFLMTLLDSYFRLGRPENAQTVFAEMGSVKQSPTPVTYETLLLGYARAGDWSSFSQVITLMKRRRFPLTIDLFDNLLMILNARHAYSTVYSLYRLALHHRLTLTTRSFNFIIKAAIAQRHLRTAHHLLLRMRLLRLRPTSHTVDQLFRLPAFTHLHHTSVRRTYTLLRTHNPNLLSRTPRNVLLTSRLAALRPHPPSLRPTLATTRTLLLHHLSRHDFTSALTTFRALLATSITPSPPLFALALRAAFSLKHEKSTGYPTALTLIQTAKNLDVPLPRDFIALAYAAANPSRGDAASILPSHGIYRDITLADRAIEEGNPSGLALLHDILESDLEPRSELVARTVLVKSCILRRDLPALKDAVREIVTRGIRVDSSFLKTLRKLQPSEWEREERRELVGWIKAGVGRGEVERGGDGLGRGGGGGGGGAVWGAAGEEREGGEGCGEEEEEGFGGGFEGGGDAACWITCWSTWWW